MQPPATADVVVIGAGVNGAAVARDAACRGLRTVLVDAEDLSAGTSAWSSRLIHGGIRYLEHAEIRLVRESLRERERLLHKAPHLVRPYGLLIPFYRHNRRPPWMLRLGMIGYDVLSFDKTTPWHRLLSTKQVAERYPGLSRDGLLGAALYYDAQALDAERLAVEQAIDVAAWGGVVLTHWRVTAIRPQASGGFEVVVKDELSGVERSIESATVVDAAGPWVDHVLGLVRGGLPRLIGGTKGSHITVKTFPGAPPTGVHYEARRDGRAILVLPIEGGHVLIGSTDIFFDGPPGDAECSDEEVEYLLSEVNQLVPDAGLTAGDVLHSYSGVRPLPFSPKARSEADVSRDHHVVPVPGLPGLYGITGGKLTTHGELGKLATDKVVRALKARKHRAATSIPKSITRQIPLPGGRSGDWEAFAESFRVRSGLDRVISDRLLRLYGTRAQRVADLAASSVDLAAVIPGTDAVLAAEVAVAMQEEFARTLTDVLARRLLLTRRDDVGLGVAVAVAVVCARVAGWDEQRTASEIDEFRVWVRKLRPRVLAEKSGAGPSQAPAPDHHDADTQEVRV